MKYYLIAGEASGDLHGANLMKALKQKDADAEFRFWGGEKMAKVGGTQIEHYKNTAFMGFWEVLKNLKKIFGFLDVCKADILSYKPDALILIDYPGFNLRIADWVKSQSIHLPTRRATLNKTKVIYYISPQVWAWKENRVKKIRANVDKMLVILPFEKAFYKKHNFDVEYVGHPLLDEIQNSKNEILKTQNEKIIALLPGSRKQEIQKILPQFLKVIKHFSGYRFIIAGLSHNEDSFYKRIIGNSTVEIVYDKTYKLLGKSHAALVASGTATLETALHKVPMLVGYKGSWFSYQIGKRLVKIDSIALVNLIMEEKIVAELIQQDLNEQNLVNELEKILVSNHREKLLSQYEILWQKLGNSGASERAAEIICSSC